MSKLKIALITSIGAMTLLIARVPGYFERFGKMNFSFKPFEMAILGAFLIIQQKTFI